MKKVYKSKGFVLIELILVMGIILLLTGFVSFSLINQQKNVSVASFEESLSADIRGQQLKAMQGFSGEAYGVYLDLTKYVLFKGTSYSPTDASNFIVELDPGIVITNVTFPQSSIIFSSTSGELNNYTDGNSSFTVQDVSAAKSINVTLNRYGVVSSKN